MDEKTRAGYKHVTIQKPKDRDHRDPKSGHAYDPVTTGRLRLVYSDSREEKLPCALNHKRRAHHSLLH